MNGFISTFWPINKLAATFTPTCVASLPWRPVQGKSAENATESMIMVACSASYHYRGKLPNRVSIEERPEVVEQRERLGDWEVDTLVGKGQRGALVSLVERKTRFTLMQPVYQRLADLVSQAMISLLSPFADLVHTITGDNGRAVPYHNGKEFANHAQIAEALKAALYFAHPYSAWERGTNENTNGLIRQYFPKKTDLSKVTFQEVFVVANKLNQRPRKCLDFYTPFEVFLEHSVALTS
jgi:IS30 family transposase